MKGRVLNIKKTTILRLSFILSALLFATLSALGFVFVGENNHFFFLFFLFVGGHLLVKAMLFRLDSSCYFGNVLFLVGAFYFYCESLNISYFYPFFAVLAFVIASLTVFCFFKQKVHLFLAFSLFSVSIGLFLYLIKFISLIFFLAIVMLSVLLLVVKILILK